jgi:acyl-CoA synthetase (AMP-forming)/AMP-acid ligase II
MQDRPLLISSLLDYAACYHPNRALVSRTGDGTIHRYDYAQAARRSAQAAHALQKLGIVPGDRVATLAWNGYRHLELFYAVSGMGAVLHTVNPRLFEDQISYIIEHGGAGILLVDIDFLPLVDRLLPSLTKLQTIIVLAGEAAVAALGRPDVLSYDMLIAGESETMTWPILDERQASALCYTSGTTGEPKGVLYSHRSTVLHAMAAAQRSAMGMGCDDVIIAIAPMYHASAWGMPYLAALTGAGLVMPGNRHDPQSLLELMNGERVTFACGVPTIWTLMLDYMRLSGETFACLNRTTIGGAAVSTTMIDNLAKLGVEVLHLWGMTEMSPLGTVATATPEVTALNDHDRHAVLAKQGRAQFGVELKIVSDKGTPLPHDGISAGALWVRGPWVASAYFSREHEPLLDSEGWFPTGDVATIDPLGYMSITDRAKDVIKSGGEWISSIALENAAATHANVALVAVIGMPDAKWDERPLMIVQCTTGTTINLRQMRDHLHDKVAKWWLPDRLELIDAMPLTATGKIRKTALRDIFLVHHT